MYQNQNRNQNQQARKMEFAGLLLREEEGTVLLIFPSFPHLFLNLQCPVLGKS